MKETLIGLSAMGLIASLPVNAFAHTALASSNIEAGTTLTTVPDTLELTFGKAVGLAKLDLVDVKTNAVQELKLERDMAKTHSVNLPKLKIGNYTIRWRAIARDGHVMNGEINFTVTN
ncbi:MAG: copper resistance CopC family protein [Litorimonas sp.]